MLFILYVHCYVLQLIKRPTSECCTSKYEPVVDKSPACHPKLYACEVTKRKRNNCFIKDVTPCTSADSNDIVNIDNKNEESENVNVNLNDVSNGSNMKTESIKRDDQDKIIEEESPNIDFDVTPVPRRSTRIRKAMDRYGAVPYI